MYGLFNFGDLEVVLQLVVGEIRCLIMLPFRFLNLLAEDFLFGLCGGKAKLILVLGLA